MAAIDFPCRDVFSPMHAYQVTMEDAEYLDVMRGTKHADFCEVMLPSGRRILGMEMNRWTWRAGEGT